MVLFLKSKNVLDDPNILSSKNFRLLSFWTRKLGKRTISSVVFIRCFNFPGNLLPRRSSFTAENLRFWLRLRDRKIFSLYFLALFSNLPSEIAWWKWRSWDFPAVKRQASVNALTSIVILQQLNSRILFVRCANFNLEDLKRCFELLPED